MKYAAPVTTKAPEENTILAAHTVIERYSGVMISIPENDSQGRVLNSI